MNTDAIFTNWRRSKQLEKIARDATRQTAHPRVCVVDNSTEPEHRYVGVAHTRFVSDNSQKCWMRWVFAMSCSREFICVMDDDLTFADGCVLADCEAWMRDHPSVDAIGAFGVKLRAGRGYWRSKHYNHGGDDTPVDIIKGRFVFLRQSSFPPIDINHDGINDTCDDICISSKLGSKALPGVLKGRFKNLGEGEHALHASKAQRDKREQAKTLYFG